MRALLLGTICALALVAAGCGTHTRRHAPTAPYTQISSPPGKPVGALILVHGGGWVQTARATLGQLAQIGAHYAARGWRTYNVAYRAKAQSLPDVLAVYDSIRAHAPGLPVCAIGDSAGGNLALLLAARRPRLNCVISMAGPTDLVALDNPKQPAYPDIHALAESIHNRLAGWSPVDLASRIRARVLLLYARDDPAVPLAQATELARRLPAARLVVLGPGPQPFVHSSVSIDDASNAARVADRLLSTVAHKG